MFGKKKHSKRPKFFCDNCGTEVPMDEKRCPKCGRFFDSVRCPACGFSGGEADFKSGCPSCGYSSGGNSGSRPDTGGKSKRPAGALPIWVYFITAAAFTAIVAALFFTVFK